MRALRVQLVRQAGGAEVADDVADDLSGMDRGVVAVHAAAEVRGGGLAFEVGGGDRGLLD